MREDVKAKYLKDGRTAEVLNSRSQGTLAQTDITTYEVKDENENFVGRLVVTEDCNLRTLENSLHVCWEGLRR